MQMKYIIPILTALLFLCLADMPYGYYQLVRFVAMVVFGWMAIEYASKEQRGMAYTFGALALLFQPFFKIALGRGLWNVVDVIVGIGLLVLWFRERSHEV